MNDSEVLAKKVNELIETYPQLVLDEFNDALGQWKVDLTHPQEYEVIGALLSRIVTLAIEIAGTPSIWNIHTAPILLRVMVDAYINLAWIFMDPEGRSEQYALYGLGQAKLHLEQMKAVNKGEKKIYDEDYLDAIESWINGQRFTFLTDVDVGNWTGGDIRKMSEEADCKDLYTFAYSPFSNAVHNTWYQIGRTNITLCVNPLHGYHFIPIIPQIQKDPEFLRLAAKYANKALNLFCEKTGIKSTKPNAYKLVLEKVIEISSIASKENDES